MQRSEYQAALQGPNLNQIIQALESDYIPSTKKDFELLVDLTRIAYSPIQDVLLRHIESIPNDKALPVYIALAKYSHSENAVSQSLNIIRKFENPEVTDAIIIATFNANVDIQLKAIRFLKNKDSDHLVEVLLDRIDYPGRAAPHAQNNHHSQIRREAIESIGAPGRVDLVEKLVDIVVNSSGFRQPVKESLIRINHPGLGDYLLKLFDDGDQKIEQALEFRFWCVEVLGRIELQNQQIEQYLPILWETFDLMLQHRNDSLNDTICKYFDHIESDMFIELVHQRYPNNTDALQIIMNALKELDLERSLHLWVALLNNVSFGKGQGNISS